MDDASPLNDRPAEGEVSLAEAAHRLGVSVESLRKRLQRGKTLRGVKRGEQWYVPLADVEADLAASTAAPWLRPDAGTPPASEPSSPPVAASTGRGQPTDATGLDAGWTRADMLERELSLTRELLDGERRRAERAERIADDAQQANAELRRLLAVAMQGRALPAPGDAPDASGPQPASGEPASIPASGPRPRRGMSPLARWLRDWLGL